MRLSLPSRHLATLAAFWAARAAAALEPTCATTENPTCGLPAILHWLTVLAIILAVALVVILILVYRYYCRVKEVTIEDPEEPE